MCEGMKHQVNRDSGVAPFDLPYDLDDARCFAEVVKSGSFTSASKNLRVPKSTLSRRLARLEEALGVQLLRRTTRKFSLTSSGEEFYQTIVRGIEVMQEAGLAVRKGSQQGGSGLIRMTAPVNFANVQIAAAVHRFRTQHPDTRVELLMTDRVLDLVRDRIDIALRAGAPVIDSRSESVVARRISWVEFIVVAAPSYLKRRGTPKTPESVEQHDCIVFDPEEDGAMEWVLHSGPKRLKLAGRPLLSSDSLPVIHELALAGAGIAFVPESFCQKEFAEGRLVHLFPEWKGERSGAYLVYPKDKFQPPRVKALLDELQKELKAVGQL